MDHTFRSLVLLLRLSFGALALTLAMLTAAALGVPAFAADLAAQGMPIPLSWPAVLLECVLALAAFFLHRPALGAGLTSGHGLDNTSAHNAF
ncbi:hypothetical protein [Massilia varians]|uniref:hypothetical protein n=1 Tax=Massilia varians TaxID=457921 RepID=UPI00255484F2|nr:hypothetical protein [Massilia varians]MDK6077237.1 hypothetical protein [Massilia varians]